MTASRAPAAVLVTGASGFVGRAVCRALAVAGTPVRGLGRHPATGPWASFHPCDLASEAPPPDALAGVDVVIHLAARTHAVDDDPGDETAYRALNVDGTRRLIDAARTAGVRRLVLASSVKAMGEGGPRCLTEDDPPCPTSAYGRTKLEAEGLVLGAGLEAVVVRLPLVYGPGAKGNLERMQRAVAAGLFPAVAAANRRSLVHVDDAAEALALAGRHPAASGRVYLVTDGAPYSTLDIHRAMCAAVGRRPPRLVLPRWPFALVARLGDALGAVLGRRLPLDSVALDKLLGSACYDSARIGRELGFRPRHRLPRGLVEGGEPAGVPR